MSNSLNGPLNDPNAGNASMLADGIAGALASLAGETYAPNTVMATLIATGSAAATQTAVLADINAGANAAAVATRMAFYALLLEYLRAKSNVSWQQYRTI